MSSLTYTEGADARTEAGRYYEIRTDVTYRIMDGKRVVGSGTGRTRAMTGSRLILSSETHAKPGARVELTMAWPVLLENRIRLKLVIKGRTVEFAGGIAVDILQYEFRTTAHAGRYPARMPAPGVRAIAAAAGE